MEVEISGPFSKLSTEDLEIMDDVVQSFCEAVDVVLKTNFKSQKRDASQMESVSRSIGTKTEGATKNQKIASVFCRQWLAGVLSELTHKLVEDTSDRYNYESTSKMMSPHLLQEGTDISSSDDIGICVENARICGNGQIEVNYDMDPASVPSHLKPKLKTQELAQLILQGKQTEQDMIQKLEGFWCDVPALLSKHLSQDLKKGDSQPGLAETGSKQGMVTQPGKVDTIPNQRKNYSFSQSDEGSMPLDDAAIELLENIVKGATSASVTDLPEDTQQKLQHLKAKADEMGIKGMDTYISLYNRVNKEVTNINRMAKFLSNLANDFIAYNS